MATKNPKPGFVEQLKKSPGKTAALALIVLVTLFIWSNALGGKKKKQRVSTPIAARPVGSPAAAPSISSASLLGPINSFDTAMNRIQVWRKPLKLHDEGKDDWVEVVLPEPTVEEFIEEEIIEEETEEELSLVLSGVSVLGSKRFAMFQGKRFEEGQNIGPYLIQKISKNRVDLLKGDEIFTLRVSDPVIGRKTREEDSNQ